MPATRFHRFAGRLDAATPPDRDRYLDALRVGAILAVVLGHWTVRTVTSGADGGLETGYLLADVPATQWATWVFQVMPLFFAVGGVANLRSWRAAQGRGETAATWVRTRARRLGRPLVALLAVWVPVAAVLSGARAADVLVFDASAAILPVWFVAVYLVVTSLTPLSARLHELGRGAAIAVPVALAAAAVLVDAARLTGALDPLGLVGGQPIAAGVNFLLVWTAVHHLGFLWTDGRLPARAGACAAMAAAAVGALWLVTVAGPYPIALVEVPGDPVSNAFPPTVTLVVLGVAQVAAAAALRPAVEPLLARPGVWAAVAVLGRRIMTVFLWHQTALVVAAAVVLRSPLWPSRAAVDAGWWVQRPVWLAVCAAVLVALAAVAGRFEDAGARRDRAPLAPAPAGRTVVGIVAASAGLAALVIGGPADPGGPLGLPVWPLALLATGAVTLGIVGSATPANPTEPADEDHVRR